MVHNQKDIKKNNTDHHDEHSSLDLRGTLMMVLLLGGLILVSWLGAFMLFMDRM